MERMPDGPGLRYKHVQYLLQEPPALSYDMIIKESDDETQLELAYLVRHLGADKKICELWLDLGCLLDILYRITATIRCAGECRSLYDLKTFPYARFTWRNSMNAPLKIEARAIDTAQQTINNLENTSTTWILITTNHNTFELYDSQPAFNFTNNHLGLYLVLANYTHQSLTLIPFTKRLSYITELGFWSRNRSRRLGMSSKGQVTLVTPSNAPFVFRWETQGLEDEEAKFIPSVTRPRDSSIYPAAPPLD